MGYFHRYFSLNVYRRLNFKDFILGIQVIFDYL